MEGGSVLIEVRLEQGKWDGLVMVLPLDEPPERLRVDDEGNVLVKEVVIGTVQEFQC